MGKVRDDVSTSKPVKAKSGPPPRGMVARFLGNLASTSQFKPKQGWNSRLYTALGLGLLVAAGTWRLYDVAIDWPPLWRLGLPVVFLAGLGWVIYRIVQFPPFAEFLISTEAEMNKVSWTSKADLVRATTVVLSSVLILALYLFVVDKVWLFLLSKIGVLQFSGGGWFGSTA